MDASNQKAKAGEVVESGVGLSTLVAWVEDAEEAFSHSRKLSERDRDYYDNKQWTAEEEATLDERGQPVITDNRIGPKIDFLVGLEQERRTDPKAYPRTPQHDQDAHAATDALRFVCESENFDQLRSSVFANMAIEGAGGCVVEVKKKRGKWMVSLVPIPWDRMITDPRSRMPDYTDSRFKGLYVWMDKDEAALKYPNAKDHIEAAFGNDAISSQTYDDKPDYWIDRKRDRIRLIEMYYKQGARWYYCVFTKGAFVVDTKESAYKDEDGISDCPIEFMSGYIDRQNARYGAVRRFIGPQDEVNKRKSKALHLLNSRQVIAERGAVDDPDDAKASLAKPDGYVEVTRDYRFEIVPTNDMAQGNILLLQEAKQSIDAVGANASMTGKDPRSQSGRALEARQQGGLIEVGVLFDRLRLFQLRVYRQIWARIRQYWTDEVWVRVTDDDSNVRFVGMNQPMTDEFGMPVIDPATGQPVLQNPVADLDVDILVEDAPNTVNIQSEQFDQLVQMYQADPQKIPIDLVIEASTLRNKDALLERLRPTPEAQQQQAQEQEEQKQIAKAGAMAEVEKTQSEAQKNTAQAAKYAAEAEGEEAEATQTQIANQVGILPPSF